jgi:hypothetical protein
MGVPGTAGCSLAKIDMAEWTGRGYQASLAEDVGTCNPE